MVPLLNQHTDVQLECVPNISEGRNTQVIQNIGNVIQSSPGVRLLDIHSDPDHNRSVYTFVGSAGSVWEAALRMTQCAIQWIDIRKHKGVHPFIGAVDVIPFIPLGNFPMAEAARLAKTLGEHIADELEIPVYLYGESAEIPERNNLAHIRSKSYEELTQGEVVTHHAPDLGPRRLHKTAGATAVGARPFLIAFNINLQTPKITVAQKIARIIREKDGGFKGVKALGVPLASRGITQVTMNITDHRAVSLQNVFEKVEKLCQKENVDIIESELVGLVPEESVFPEFVKRLQLKDFSEKKILPIFP